MSTKRCDVRQFVPRLKREHSPTDVHKHRSRTVIWDINKATYVRDTDILTTFHYIKGQSLPIPEKSYLSNFFHRIRVSNVIHNILIFVTVIQGIFTSS
jgi:hypothetical protein